VSPDLERGEEEETGGGAGTVVARIGIGPTDLAINYNQWDM